MVIHTFGGYYGLAISWVLYRPNLHQSKRMQGSVYHSDTFAMIGELVVHCINIRLVLICSVWVSLALVMVTYLRFVEVFCHGTVPVLKCV